MPPRNQNNLILPRRKPSIGTPVDWTHPLTRGLIGAWPLNEGSTSVWNAAQPTEVAAIVSTGNILPTWDPGLYGSAINFIGQDGLGAGAYQGIYVGTYARYQVQAHSFVLWARTGRVDQPLAGAQYSIVSRSDDITIGGYEWSLNTNNNFNDARLAFAYVDGSGVQGWYRDSIAVVAGSTEYMLAGTWTAGTVRFYVNARATDVITTTSGTITHQTTDTFSIAHQSLNTTPSQNASWDGNMHQLLFYNRVLSQAEINQLYAYPFDIYVQKAPTSVIFDMGPPSAGGTTFTNSLTGSVSTITGALVKQGRKPFTATVATITGTLLRRTNKVLTGAVATIAGTLVKLVTKLAFSGTIATITGTLTTRLISLRTLVGSVNSSATLALKTNFVRTFTGTILSSGALTKLVSKPLTGAVATITATLTQTRAVVRAFAGSVNSAATLLLRTNKPLTASVTPTATITKLTRKAFTASIATITGVTLTTRAVVRAFAGSVNSSATIVRRANKPLVAAVDSLSTITNRARKSFAATITSSGALTRFRSTVLSLTGAVNSSATLVKRPIKVLTAIVNSSATINQTVQLLLAGFIDSSGRIVKNVSKRLTGLVSTITGLLVRVPFIIANIIEATPVYTATDTPGATYTTLDSVTSEYSVRDKLAR